MVIGIVRVTCNRYDFDGVHSWIGSAVLWFPRSCGICATKMKYELRIASPSNFTLTMPKSDIQHHRQANDLRRCIEIFERILLCHSAKLWTNVKTVKLLWHLRICKSWIDPYRSFRILVNFLRKTLLWRSVIVRYQSLGSLVARARQYPVPCHTVVETRSQLPAGWTAVNGFLNVDWR